MSTSQDAAMQREAGERAGTGGDQDHGPRTTSNKCKRKRPPVFHSTPSTPYANPATNNAPLGWNIWHVKRTRGGFSGYCSLKVRRSAYTPPETNHPNHQPNAEPDAHKKQGSKGPRPVTTSANKQTTPQVRTPQPVPQARVKKKESCSPDQATT